jgi:hypothetical protein
MADRSSKIGTSPRGPLELMGPIPTDPNAAGEEDLRVARAQAVALYRMFMAPGLLNAAGLTSLSSTMVGTMLLGAVMLGKLRAEAAAEPESFVSNMLPLLEKEVEFLAEESLAGRARSLAGGSTWTPISDLEERASETLGLKATSRGGDA